MAAQRSINDDAAAWARAALGDTATYSVHVAVRGLENELEAELTHRNVEIVTRLRSPNRTVVVVRGSDSEAQWAAETWWDATVVHIGSISEAARVLQAVQRNWAPAEQSARERLIAQRLPRLRRSPLALGQSAASGHLGAWTLVAPDLMLVAPRTSRPFASGRPELDLQSEPPSRAYLKLWEAMLLAGTQPAAGDLAVDLGAFPGGWSWLLARLGANVDALDRSTFDPRGWNVAGRVTVRRGNGLSATPHADATWIVSDMACDPRKLLAAFTRWLERPAQIVATIKCAGRADPGVVAQFAALPGVRVVHLHHNGHELTAMRTHTSSA